MSAVLDAGRGANKRLNRRMLSGGRVLTSLLLLVSGATCHPQSPRPGDILLITVDTLRPDHLGIYGYARPTSPNVDRIFEDAAIFERTYGTHASTPPSVVSILSGHLPQDHGVRGFYILIPHETMIIPDLLPAAYQTAAFVSNAVVTDEAMGLASRFDHFDDHVDTRAANTSNIERLAAPTTDAALDWLLTQRDPQRPAFVWVHYMDPHAPYTAPEDRPRSFSHDGEVWVDVEDVAPVIQREVSAQRLERIDGLTYVDAYDEEIAYTDAAIGRLLDGYAARYPLEEALVIFTADHGEALLQHAPHFLHGYDVLDSIVRVPLLIRGPGVAPGRYGEIASGVDIAPTVLAFAEGRVPPSLPGIDLRRERGGEGRVVYTRAWTLDSHIAAAVTDAGKWVIERPTVDGKAIEHKTYDLKADPEEKHALKWRNGPAGIALEHLLERDPKLDPEAWRKRAGRKPRAHHVSPRVNEEQKRKLRALGYLE
jgi:arylsulfatase A-like enzyme